MAPTTRRTAAAAGFASPSPAKATRRAKAEVRDRVEAVVAALGAEALMPPSVPRRVLEMLAAGAPHALSAAVEERHPLQAAVLDHIREVFTEADKGLTSRQSKAQAAADEKNAEIEAVSEKLQAASESIASAEQAVDAQKAAVSEQEAAVKSAEQEQRAAEAGQKSNLKEQAGLQKRLDAVKVVQDGSFAALIECNFESGQDPRKVCTKFVKDMEKLGAEPSLLASAPAVLLKSKDERVGFDQMVIDSLRGHLTERLTAAEAALATNVAAGQELETATGERAAAVEAAHTERAARAEALGAAVAELAEKRGAAGDLEAQAEGLRGAHAELIGAVADVQEELQCLRESTDALEALAARSLVAAPPAAAADEAAASAEGAATAAA